MADPSTHPTGSEAGQISDLVTAKLGIEVVGVEPLAVGIGTRSFYRVTTRGQPATLIARIEADEDPRGRPPGIPPEPGLEPIRSLLAGAGLPVAEHLGGDGDRTDLLEDLGEASLQQTLATASPAARSALYREIVGWVPVLQGLEEGASPVPAFHRRLEHAHFRYKAELFGHYGLVEASSSELALIAQTFEAISKALSSAPLRLAHRDLQSQNVLVYGGRPFMIDFQGALLAPPEYDLVCLLRDGYAALPEAEVAAHLEWVRPRLPDAPDRGAFEERFDWLTVARKAKDLARYVYAARERDDRRYLAYLPGTWALLVDAAARAAQRDTRFSGFAELIAERGAPCVR